MSTATPLPPAELKFDLAGFSPRWSSTSSPNGAALLDDLARYATRLWEALALPGAPAVTITTAETSAADTGARVRLFFNERSLPVAGWHWSAAAAATVQQEQLFTFLAETLYRARLDLIDDAGRPLIVRNAPEKEGIWTRLTSDEQKGLGRRLLALNRSLTSLDTLELDLDQLPAGLDRVDFLVEAVMAPQKSIRLQISYPVGEDPPALEGLNDLRLMLFREKGLLLPSFKTAADENLPPGALGIWINDAPLPPLRSPEPLAGTLTRALSANAASFLSQELLLHQIDALRANRNGLVEAFLFGRPAAQLSAVIRQLAADSLSIREMPLILESWLAIDQTAGQDLSQLITFGQYTGLMSEHAAVKTAADLSPSQLADVIRRGLYLQLSQTYSQDLDMAAILLTPELERTLQARASHLPDEAVFWEPFWEEIRILRSSAAQTAPVLLTSFELRRLVQERVEPALPDLPVLAYQELSPTTNIQIVGRVEWRPEFI